MENETPLKQWLADNGRTMRWLARELDVSNTTAARYATGEIACDADRVARIKDLTGGAVSEREMHATRLDWLAANQPERVGRVRGECDSAGATGRAEGGQETSEPLRATAPAGDDAS